MRSTRSSTLPQKSWMEDSKPFSISVVIPAYNAARVLRRSIGSALKQTVAPLEVIVVDDGSSDRPQDVVREFGDTVRYIRQENAGPAAARNHGVREARGEFIAFLDADDEWYPHHLEDAARILTAHEELQWFCSPFEERLGHRTTHRRRYNGSFLKGHAYIDDYFKAQAEYWFAWTGAMIIRKQAILEVGGFDESLYGPEDIDLWFRVALKNPRIAYSRKISSIYYRQPGSITWDRSRSEIEPLSKRIEKLERLARQAGAAAVKRSEPVILAWAGALIRLCLHEGRRRLAHDVYMRYRDRLPLTDRLLVPLSRYVPGAWGPKLYAIFLFKLNEIRKTFWRLLRKAGSGAA